jgi:UDP-glucose:glycoprotein glucosyltransferase
MPSVEQLLRRVYPGSIPSIGLNIFNVVVVLDLADTSSLQFVSDTVSTYISRGFPIRFGIVPAVTTAPSQDDLCKFRE